MAEQKTRPAAKKIATARTTGKVAGKAKSTKTKSASTAKTTLVKNTVVAAPHKSKAAVVKKEAVSAVKEKAVTKQPLGTMITPQTAISRPVTAKNAAKPTPEERYRMVETEAYFIAERHGFQGRTEEHWAAAEREIAARLGQ